MNASTLCPPSRSHRPTRVGVLLLLAMSMSACASEREGDHPLADALASDQPDKKTEQSAGPNTTEDASDAPTPEPSPKQEEKQETEKADEPVNENPEWDYEEGGDMGPDLWGDLSPAYSACKTGQAQSPIDITKAKRDRNLPNIKLEYSPAPYEAVDTGHTIALNFPAGRFVTVGAERYELVRFEFHSGSEHTIHGKREPMELQMVHKTKSGGLAIFATLVKAGNRNTTLTTLLENLPDPGATLSKPKLNIDPAGFLPLSLQYFAYDGSLTTPPCTEGVRWYVLRTPITASQEQIDAFKKLYGASHRPAQALNKREVTTKYHF